MFITSTWVQLSICGKQNSNSTKTSLLHHILHLDPLPDHPKSSIGCIKIHCGGWEAMVWVFCQLAARMMAQK
jgi:hypothetical protein